MSQMVMGCKTPVSILQEMCVKRNCPPQYELLMYVGGSHEPQFKFKVEAAGVTAVGTGRSKKEAKHDAARRALEQLAKIGNECPKVQIPEDALEVESPYKDKIQENAIGALQDLCATNQCPEPEYVLIAEDGPPHARIFTYQCLVSKHKETAVGRTKKQAKQLAASKMMTRLKGLPNIVDSSVLEKKSEEVCANGEEVQNSKKKDEVVSRYLDLSGIPKHEVPMKQVMSDYHLCLTYLSEEDIDSVLDNRNNSDDSRDEVDDLSLLAQLMQKLEIQYSFMEMEGIKQHGNCLILLHLSTNPVSVLYGLGKSVTEAKMAAATNALNYIDIMCRIKRKVPKEKINAAIS